ncbi:RagB/SusD family nutrient uptake outer membrane protein [uncultured Sanguibacteroides sp.]|uniref:RagB/SusD family nutrient uptake outer membrane protein n=1 Tax=uncultured Sanguibacteroides sp. TaxID=1635151 RepID=UPI0025F95AE9|nr:RagB/SusD family nutrient uptake outer membrane protein [uncultured Sanguibacteroides sp.]
MKKYYLHLYTMFLSAVLCFTGCNAFLDVSPDERMEIDNLDKVYQMITGAYQNKYGFRFTHMSSDDVTAVKGVNRTQETIEDLYKWSRNFQNQTHQDAPASYWTVTYSSIANINHALEAMDQLKILPEESAKAEVIRGEALIIRSYSHFMLVNLFAKHYDKATAPTDPGVPYVVKPEDKLVIRYKRASVEEVYQLAEKDLQEGIRLLEKHPKLFNPSKYHFTFPTIYLYASRFYTFRNRDKKDVKQAIEYANQAIQHFGGLLVMRSWSEYSKDQEGPIDITQNEVGLVQISATMVNYAFIYQLTEEIRDTELKNPFKQNDLRLKAKYLTSGNIYTPMYFFVPEKKNTLYSAYDLFPMSEALLNAAEGYAREENFDKALDMLHALGKKVYYNYNSSKVSRATIQKAYPADTEQESMIRYILFERRVQFLMKGMRWFDIKRYNLDVEHLLQDGTTIRLSEIAPNKDYQIPSYAIEAGLEPNK